MQYTNIVPTLLAAYRRSTGHNQIAVVRALASMFACRYIDPQFSEQNNVHVWVIMTWIHSDSPDTTTTQTCLRMYEGMTKKNETGLQSCVVMARNTFPEVRSTGKHTYSIPSY